MTVFQLRFNIVMLDPARRCWSWWALGVCYRRCHGDCAAGLPV